MALFFSFYEILEVEHKCCCPDGCPANIPPTLSTPTSHPSTVSPSTFHPPFTSKTYISSDLSSKGHDEQTNG